MATESLTQSGELIGGPVLTRDDELRLSAINLAISQNSLVKYAANVDQVTAETVLADAKTYYAWLSEEGAD